MFKPAREATASERGDVRSSRPGPCVQRRDPELLGSFIATGDQEAFAELVARHGPMVYRTCYRLLGNSHDAEEAAQAVFLLLVRRARAAATSPAGWLHRVALNVALMQLRSRARQARREEKAVIAKPASSSETTNDLRQELDAAMAELPWRLREAIILCHLEGRRQEEAARLLGCDQSTLSRRIGNGLDRLRTILVRRGVVVAPAALLGFLTVEHSASAVPAAALVKLSALGSSVSLAGATATLLADGVLRSLFWAKLKLFSLLAAAAVVTVGTTYVVSRPKEPGLVGHFAFSEGQGKQTADASPSANNGTLVGGVTWTAGPKPGSKALGFDGKTGHVKVSQDFNQWLGGTATVAFWIKTRQANQRDEWLAPGVMVSSAGTFSDNDVCWGDIDAGGRIGISVGDKAPGSAQSVRSARPINDDRWHHLGMTRDAGSGEVQVFIDGQLSARGKLKPGVKTMPIDSIGQWYHPDHRVTPFF
jgi:RNA polymerase sigma factor (sigma-70 family)